jgi:glutamate racemase
MNTSESKKGLEPVSEPIGIFDSGVGGLTFLNQLQRLLPKENKTYFGDTARVPYGNRSSEEIQQFMRQTMTWMEHQEVKLVVAACNTSCALALEIVRKEFQTPIVGLILPGAKAAVQRGRRIGVIASQAYTSAMKELDPTVKVFEVACPEFVPLVESGQVNSHQARKVAINYLQPLLNERIDTLVYGCTHYPHLEPIFKSFLPDYITLVDPSVETALAVNRELQLLGLLSNSIKPGKTNFYVSGDPASFSRLAKRWSSTAAAIETVQIDPQAVPSPLEESSSTS